ncbi:AraC family transcriptional regulator [Granulicella mallensis]|uniref:AraC-like DNA-binding protein n=1 Tax=Granulicella mallensis TaxID=940614 RepID=A0A7W8E8U5_9BACT|nr:AraC family transcriptional regulator [Granulicella mallensis]MBB5063813.1 AraC-like DNA-binding protein [Granulicella mallensis]
MGRIWNDITVYGVTTYSAPGKSWQSLESDQSTVAVILDQEGGIAEPRKRLNAPTPRVRYDAGHTMYIPANTDIWAFGDSTSIVRGVRMLFNLSVVDGLLQDECDRVRWSEPVLLLYDNRIREIAKLIWEECHSEGERPLLYGESLTTALLSCLFQSSDAQKKTSQSGLTRIQLKRTVEYMRASLLRDVRLKELASVAGLSPSHFGRAFKRSTGLTPHRWILQHRVQLAQRLMRESGKPIVIAAEMAGFSNQSHFTKVFRASTGTTPRAWLHNVAQRSHNGAD